MFLFIVWTVTNHKLNDFAPPSVLPSMSGPTVVNWSAVAGGENMPVRGSSAGVSAGKI